MVSSTTRGRTLAVRSRLLRRVAYGTTSVLLAVAIVACGSSTLPPSAADISNPSAGAPSPSTAAPLYTGPPDEYFPRLAACLQAAGFVAEVVEGGQALQYSYGSEAQRPAFEQAKAECDQEIGVPPPPSMLSEAEIRERYAFLVEARACLIAAGHDLPEPPSEDAFVESWATHPWSPFNDLPSMSTEAWASLIEECPQA